MKMSVGFSSRPINYIPTMCLHRISIDCWLIISVTVDWTGCRSERSEEEWRRVKGRCFNSSAAEQWTEAVVGQQITFVKYSVDETFNFNYSHQTQLKGGIILISSPSLSLSTPLQAHCSTLWGPICRTTAFEEGTGTGLTRLLVKS